MVLKIKKSDGTKTRKIKKRIEAANIKWLNNRKRQLEKKEKKGSLKRKLNDIKPVAQNKKPKLAIPVELKNPNPSLSLISKVLPPETPSPQKISIKSAVKSNKRPMLLLKNSPQKSRTKKNTPMLLLKNSPEWSRTKKNTPMLLLKNSHERYQKEEEAAAIKRQEEEAKKYQYRRYGDLGTAEAEKRKEIDKMKKEQERNEKIKQFQEKMERKRRNKAAKKIQNKFVSYQSYKSKKDRDKRIENDKKMLEQNNKKKEELANKLQNLEVQLENQRLEKLHYLAEYEKEKNALNQQFIDAVNKGKEKEKNAAEANKKLAIIEEKLKLKEKALQDKKDAEEAAKKAIKDAEEAAKKVIKDAEEAAKKEEEKKIREEKEEKKRLNDIKNELRKEAKIGQQTRRDYAKEKKEKIQKNIKYNNDHKEVVPFYNRGIFGETDAQKMLKIKQANEQKKLEEQIQLAEELAEESKNESKRNKQTVFQRFGDDVKGYIPDLAFFKKPNPPK